MGHTGLVFRKNMPLSLFDTFAQSQTKRYERPLYYELLLLSMMRVFRCRKLHVLSPKDRIFLCGKFFTPTLPGVGGHEKMSREGNRRPYFKREVRLEIVALSTRPRGSRAGECVPSALMQSVVAGLSPPLVLSRTIHPAAYGRSGRRLSAVDETYQAKRKYTDAQH